MIYAKAEVLSYVLLAMVLASSTTLLSTILLGPMHGIAVSVILSVTSFALSVVAQVRT